MHPVGVSQAAGATTAIGTEGSRYSPTGRNLDLQSKKRELEEAIGRLLLAFQTETGLRIAGLSVAGVDTKVCQAGQSIPCVTVDARL